jgi:hypothetical protein
MAGRKHSSRLCLTTLHILHLIEDKFVIMYMHLSLVDSA